jgi:hypothetical protein
MPADLEHLSLKCRLYRDREMAHQPCSGSCDRSHGTPGIFCDQPCQCGCHGAAQEPEGAWQCSDGHMFRYEPPPAWPPFCAVAGCFARGEFRWILKDDVTSRDWIR